MYLSAWLQLGMEDGFAMFIHEEGVDRSPLVSAEECLDLVQSGINPSHADCPG